MVAINKELLFGKYICYECGDIYDNSMDALTCKKANGIRNLINNI